MVRELIKRFVRPILYDHVVSTPMFARYMGWRRAKLKRTYISLRGNVVASGPFAGMRLHPDYSELPKFLGTCEAPLHPAIRTLIARSYDVVLNIGCAEGYYTIGFARVMPAVRVEAFDIDTIQRTRCRINVDLNGVADRVCIASRFHGEMFDSFDSQRILVICDIEGDEVDLLRPDKWHGLRTIDLLVELHEEKAQDIVGLFQTRFHATHDMTHIPRQLITDLRPIEELFNFEMDQLAAIYENRFGPTSWLLLLRR